MTVLDDTMREASRGEASAPHGHGGTNAGPPAVPPTAKWLGGLGALPFVGLAAAGLAAEPALGEFARLALAAYGAVILSFLGGVHWGLAMAGLGPDSGVCRTARRLAYSVIPSLVGWGALFVARPLGLLILAAAFTGMLLFDGRASRIGEAPLWYRRLRLPLTGVVVAALVVGAAG
ncbi:MAG: DUF3429 domain-containing protein [Rhodospirillales bacterium]|nr:MAG: DUF3429 domain-containing protein [Rhodospirillales bacterium]